MDTNGSPARTISKFVSARMPKPTREVRAGREMRALPRESSDAAMGKEKSSVLTKESAEQLKRSDQRPESTRSLCLDGSAAGPHASGIDMRVGTR